jgi:hypothetical protein
LLAIVALLAATGLAGQARASTLLRLDGIGPLRLDMTRTDALATHWLAHRTTGCPLGGPPLPVDYSFTGSDAPDGILGSAEFVGGRLQNLSFTDGVRTRAGVVVGSTSPADMVARYRSAGFVARATYDSLFGGRFVSVRRPHGDQVLGGFARHGVVTTLAVRYVPVCE